MTASPAAATGERTATPRLVVVTGMSGAGKSTALNILEDLGFEVVDNLPLSLLRLLVPGQAGLTRSLAVGIDIRTRDFSAAALQDLIGRIGREASLKPVVVFIDADDETLRRRYTETRRRHPLALDRPLMDGIRHERDITGPLLDMADLRIDTTDLATADFRRLLTGHFETGRRQEMTVFITSFSFRRGLPREADLVFDVRFLKNPHYEPALKDRTGLDGAVAAYIEGDPCFNVFLDDLKALLSPLLPRYAEEGKSYLTIAVGCTGGQHRSVHIAEKLTAFMQSRGLRTILRHRELDRDLSREDTTQRAGCEEP